MRATCSGRVRATLCRPPLIHDPEHWRERADEARNLADDMKDEISKQMMLQITADYGYLARRARARRWRSRFPAPSAR